MRIFLDIETIPDQREGAIDLARDRIKVPSNYKKPESIEQYIADHAEEEYRRTALNGGYGEVWCVSYAVDEEGVVVLAQSPELGMGEKELLMGLRGDFKDLTQSHRPFWIGHNIEFDLRFLFHRFVVHGIKPGFHIPYNDAVWKGTYYDTMYAWAGARGSIKLKELCHILGIEQGADDIDGSEVWDAIQAERYTDVVEHCEADVRRVREVWRRLTFQE